MNLKVLKTVGIYSTSLENSLLEADDIPIIKCHSTPNKNKKVLDITSDMELTEFKDTFQGYFDEEKIE